MEAPGRAPGQGYFSPPPSLCSCRRRTPCPELSPLSSMHDADVSTREHARKLWKSPEDAQAQAVQRDSSQAGRFGRLADALEG